MATTQTRAYANIALIKYWGKRDEKLFLPTKSSLSISVPNLQTKTTLRLRPLILSARSNPSIHPPSLKTTGDTPDLRQSLRWARQGERNVKTDTITLNGKQASQDSYAKIVSFLDYFRTTFGVNDHFIIESENSFPTAAGLASSASGFAALTKALNDLYKLNLSDKELSILARHGSGSACRSIYNGFVLWHKGERDDGSDSYAEQLFDEHHWPEFCIIPLIVEKKEKKVSSRAGMQQTVASSPLYKQWIEKSEQRIPLMIDAIKHKDFYTVGALAEHDCLEMHECMHTTTPALDYWTPETVKIMQTVRKLRENGVACYCTIDAGPNVKIMYLQPDTQKILPSFSP